jgi:hypothetical protein
MRSILRRHVLRRLVLVTAAVLPVTVFAVATSGYAARPVKPATGCYEFAPLDPPIPPLPLSDCQLSLVLNAAVSSDVPVAVRTVDGTARAGEDFVGVDRVMVIPAGAVELGVGIPIVSDGVAEREELFTVVFEVLAPDLAERVAAEVTIRDGGDRSR